MAKKFTKSNMYDWIKNDQDKKRLREIDSKAGPLITEKQRILKKNSSKNRLDRVKIK
ncbi:MAG: hypothetical protein MUC49_02325 [Raineya sp.]|jgi:hypothetical protein|nr:hypothetical protein [Raineya sp.]